MHGLVEEFRERLSKQYGSGAEQVEVLVGRFLGLWDKARRSFHCEGKAIMLLPVGDPAYEWLDFLSRHLLLDALQGNNDERHSSEWVRAGFVFSVLATPGCDGEDIVRLCSEAMKDASPLEWSICCALAEARYILEGCDARSRLQRQLWAAIARAGELASEQIEETGIFPCAPSTAFYREEDDVAMQFIVGRRDHVPFFLVTGGENLSDAAIYEMQDLALRGGCRFLILAASEDPGSFQYAFGGEHTVSESIYDLLPFEEAIAEPGNVIAGVMEAGFLVQQMEEWCSGVGADESIAIAETLAIPFAVSSSIINQLRKECHEEG